MMRRSEGRYSLLSQMGVFAVGAYRAFGAWELAESGPGPTSQGFCDGIDGAAWNILNTTRLMPGSTLYGTNTAGVQNYVSFAQGREAMLKTLQQTNMAGIVAACKAPNAQAQDILEAVAKTKWGTSLEGLMAALIAYQANRSYYDNWRYGT